MLRTRVFSCAPRLRSMTARWPCPSPACSVRICPSDWPRVDAVRRADRRLTVCSLVTTLGGSGPVGCAGWLLRSPADLWLTRRGLGLLARLPRTGLPRCRFAECPGDGLPRPAHTCRREFGVVAELLGDPLGAAPGAEPTEGRGGGPP